jgi:hypothetical protein
VLRARLASRATRARIVQWIRYFVRWGHTAPGERWTVLRAVLDICVWYHLSYRIQIMLYCYLSSFYFKPGSTSPSPPGSECPIGGYCNPAGFYQLCPPGTYGVVSGGRSLEHACAACEPGYFCPGNGTVEASMRLCSQGGYCPRGSALPLNCDPGTKSSATGQISPATCTPCSRGNHCPFSGTIFELRCPQGFYCPVGTSDPIGCPAGTFGETDGLHTAAQCVNCTVGNFCPVGTASPQRCPGGTYMPFRAATSSSSCRPCEPGYACPASGMSYMTTPCAAGSYCPPGTQFPNQNLCPAGTFSDATDLASFESCQQCPEGYSCASGTTSATLLPCPAGEPSFHVPVDFSDIFKFASLTAGFFCPSSTASGSEQRCPPGRYSSNTQLASSEDCNVCPAGSFCAGGASSLVVTGPCAAGHYCPEESHSSTANPCPAGTYSDRTDLSDASQVSRQYAVYCGCGLKILMVRSTLQCQKCSPGSFCVSASVEMSPCPAGRYTSVPGTTSSFGPEAPSCLSCPAGSMCLEGSAAPISCGVGTYSISDSSECAECPRGYYCGDNTTSDTNLFTGGGRWEDISDSAGMCFNGTYCEAGMRRAPDLLRDACPAG